MLVWAQAEDDVFEFSSINYAGTAKSAAMGNAMGAVGSDFSAIAINPAGLGLIRKATFVYTPSFFSISSESKYQGNNGSDRAFKLPSNNIGLTWTTDINDGSLKTVSFALGINRLNNYAYASYVNGNNMHTSLVDAYITELYIKHISDDNALKNYAENSIFPLWDTYLLNFYEDGSIDSPIPQGGLNQQYGISQNGNSKEFTFASGFNFNDKTFLGVSVNIPYFSKSSTTEYKEINLNNWNTPFRNWTYEEKVKTTGTGISAKIGAIVFPAKWIRLGVALHTPSIYKVDESWSTNTRAVFADSINESPSLTSTYSYTLSTPLRLNASAAFIFGNFGMISADYEYIDYSKIRVSSYDFNYSSFNDYIRGYYKATSNIRIGTEWRWQRLAFRAGYAFYGSPFGFDKKELRTNSYSCGLGYTYHRFTLDLAYVLSQRTNEYNLYSKYSYYPAYYQDANGNFVTDETKVKETTTTNQVVVSFKFRLD